MFDDGAYHQMLSSLRRAGMRLTPQRMAVARALAGNRDHPTAQSLFQALRPAIPSLSLTTVYNTLDRLVDLGLVNELGPAADGRVHYDADTRPHFNLFCTTCGKVEDLRGRRVAPRLDAVSRRAGYDIHGARLVYYGLCPACRKRAGAHSH